MKKKKIYPTEAGEYILFFACECPDQIAYFSPDEKYFLSINMLLCDKHFGRKTSTKKLLDHFKSWEKLPKDWWEQEEELNSKCPSCGAKITR